MRQHASRRGRPLVRLALGVAAPAVALAVGATAVHADVGPASDTTTLAADATTPQGGSAAAAGAAAAAADPAADPAANPAADPAANPAADSAVADQAATPGAGQTTATASNGADQPPPAPDAVAADAAAAKPAADPPLGTPADAAAPPATTPAADRAPMVLTPPGAVQAVATDPQENANCTLVVPPDPLSAKGLATPYRLIATDPTAGPCREANKNQSAFVQAAVLTRQGRLSLYNPLVVTDGTTPAAAPVRAFVPAGSTVGIWFGFNGDTLTLAASGRGAGSLRQGQCVNGKARPFGQFAYCNAPAFFRAANAAIAAGRLRVPRIGTARDKLPCPTVRDFSVVDQDQSDNVNTHYLATADGRTAQPGASGRLTGTDLANGSDNRLLTEFILPTLGCRSFTRPDQSNKGLLTASLPLQELQAATGQPAPVALVPLNDPMTTENGQPSRVKTNLFRAGVGQPRLGGRDNGDPKAYCQGLYENPRGISRVFAAREIFAEGRSPDPDAATNLFTFLAARASAAYGILGCEKLLNKKDPITLTKDGDKVTDATFGTGQAAAGQAGAAD